MDKFIHLPITCVHTVLVVVACFSALTQAACPSCAQCPCFNSAPYTFTISEDAAIGMEVGTITATPRNSFDLTYSTSSPSSSLFVIDSTTGVLTVGGSLDFESQESHAVTVIATDNDYESSERVTINILNINDNPPQCSLSVVYISLPENQSTASFQLPDCTDADSPANPVFSYEISGSLVDFFNVDANGNITLMRPLDFEERSLYDISIRINDTDIPPGSLSAWIRVIVTVEPVNEFSPVFADDVIAFAISESATVGSVVGRVSAVDEDSGRDGEVTYSISSVQTDAFIVNALTGDIILVSTLDYEQTTSYTLNVTATDSSTSSRISSAALITINVLDSNDNSPVYAQPVHYIEVAENSAPGSLLTQHSCTDLDSGVNKELVYSISSGNDRGIFDIDTSSGNVTLASAINYDSSPDSDFFRLTIQCEEVAPPNRLSETLLLVGVTSFNSYTPQPTDTEFEATVSEDTAPGTVLTQVQATDRDRGLDGTLRYYINYEGQLSTCPDDVVLVDESSGIVYLISPLDYETGIRDIYCMVTIWDSGYIRRSSEVDLIISVTDVNDELPRCDPTISTVYIEENANVGDTVFSVACNDVDSNILQYSIVSTQSLPFQIEPDGNIVLQSPLDYETEPFYLFSVQVSDGMFATNTTIRVTVGNVNEYSPTFSQETYHCSLLENTPIGETISCDFNAVDNDSSMEGEVRYRLVSVSNLFQLSPEGHLVLAAPHVDLTAQSDYLLEIEAYDLGSPSLSSRTFINLTVLDVNDNAPSMPRLLFASIPENSSPSTTITTVMCTDVDEGLNGEVELSIVHVSRLAENGYLNVTELQLYNIDPANGELSVRGGLDFETARQYKLTILCRDQGTPSLSSVTSLFIEILPQNEYPPVVTLPSDTLLVPEATSIGTSLLTIQATDEDHGADGVVHFSLSPVSGHAPFEINRRSGVIVLSGPLDCDRTVQYELMVEVEDRGQPKRSTQASLTVNITTCHLGSVEPNSYAYALSVPENAPVGESVGTVSCSSTRMNVLTDINPVYQIISGGNGHFEIDSLSGEITVSDSPDYEIQTAHQLMIECYDPNHQHIADTFTAFINVLPINEFTPMFSESSFRVNVSEDALLGDFVLQLEAIDRDSGQDGELLFSIVGQDSSAFLIDQHTGRVYLAASLDREAVDELTFTASAQDLTTDVALRRSAGTTVTVSVTDINDNSPQCEHVVHHLIVSPRTTAPHTLVSDFACTDADTNQNSDLTYEFSDTSVPENLFEIDSRQLLLRNNLDSSGPPHYYLPVRVQDGGSPSLATNLLVIIEVQEPDIDESGVDLLSQVKEEGLKNTVWIRMEGLSIESWERTGADEKFQQAVAKSVTHFCALLPEACSIISGCSEFYGVREKRSIPDNYANFPEASVVISSNSTNVSADSTTSLGIQFYVTLPIEVSRSPNRETNYVVPRATLDLIVEEDGQTIEAVVRDTVTQRTTVEQGFPTWAIIVLSVVGGTVVGVAGGLAIFALIYRRCVAMKKKLKREGEDVTLINLEPMPPRRERVSSSSSADSDSAVCDTSNQRKWNIADLVRLLGHKRGSTTTTTTVTPSKQESNSRGSSNSSDISIKAVCDDRRGKGQVPGVFYGDQSNYEEEDDISEIYLDDETPNSGGTSMENLCSQEGTSRRILSNLLRQKRATRLESPPHENIPSDPPRPSLRLSLPKWK